MKTLFRGGTVVTGHGTRRADVLLDGETVAAVGRDLPAEGARVVDCAGKLLLPGFIDAHTHFDLDVCNTTTADDFASGSRAALRGGTTTVVDFACPNKGETLHQGLRLWHEKADGKCACDYGFHMTIDDWNPTIASEIDDMYDEGITSFKMYMTYPAMMIGDEAIYHALRKLREKGGISGFHCENSGVIDALVSERKAAGDNGVWCHPRVRPDYLEAEAVGRLMRIAQAADVPVIVVHTTNAQALAEIRAARRRGQKVYVETCPQYLCLDDSVYDQEDWLESAKYVCSPPIRSAADRDALWGAVCDGRIDILSTDHCSFNFKGQKELGLGNFSRIPNGLPGVEFRPSVVWTAGVAAGRITAEDMCRLMCETPAKAFGLWGRKGALEPGFDADIVVWDPTYRGVIDPAAQETACDYSPWEGMEIAGRAAAVYLRGELSARDGRCVRKGGGVYLHRGAPIL